MAGETAAQVMAAQRGGDINALVARQESEKQQNAYLQQVQQQQQALQQQEQNRVNDINQFNYDASRLSAAQMVQKYGSAVQPIYGKVVKGGANEVVGYTYDSPYGQISTDVPRQRLEVQQANVQAFEKAQASATPMYLTPMGFISPYAPRGMITTKLEGSKLGTTLSVYGQKPVYVESTISPQTAKRVYGTQTETPAPTPAPVKLNFWGKIGQAYQRAEETVSRYTTKPLFSLGNIIGVDIASQKTQEALAPSLIGIGPFGFKPTDYKQVYGGVTSSIITSIKEKPIMNVALFELGMGIGTVTRGLPLVAQAVSPVAGSLTKAAVTGVGTGLAGTYIAGKAQQVLAAPSATQAGAILGTAGRESFLVGLGVPYGQRGAEKIYGAIVTRGMKDVTPYATDPFVQSGERRFVETKRTFSSPEAKAAFDVKVFRTGSPELEAALGVQRGGIHVTPQAQAEFGTLTRALHIAPKASTVFGDITPTSSSIVPEITTLQALKTFAANIGTVNEPGLVYVEAPGGFKAKVGTEVQRGTYVFKEPLTSSETTPGFVNVPFNPAYIETQGIKIPFSQALRPIGVGEALVPGTKPEIQAVFIPGKGETISGISNLPSGYGLESSPIISSSSGYASVISPSAVKSSVVSISPSTSSIISYAPKSKPYVPYSSPSSKPYSISYAPTSISYIAPPSVSPVTTSSISSAPSGTSYTYTPSISAAPNYTWGYKTKKTEDLLKKAKRITDLRAKAYKTFVIKGKKKVYLPGISPRETAIKKGENVALGSLVATFGVEPTNIDIRGIESGYQPSEQVFRGYRIKGTSKIPLRDIWIQKSGGRREPTIRGARLASAGERMELKASRRRRLFR